MALDAIMVEQRGRNVKTWQPAPIRGNDPGE